ncbi:MAG: hypothetical protein LBJ71_00215 [Holosporaceae bacterium]|jgi:hypothetical protein|nr:hypothetical protein [Holosporaceae bacterium]
MKKEKTFPSEMLVAAFTAILCVSSNNICFATEAVKTADQLLREEENYLSKIIDDFALTYRELKDMHDTLRDELASCGTWNILTNKKGEEVWNQIRDNGKKKLVVFTGDIETNYTKSQREIDKNLNFVEILTRAYGYCLYYAIGFDRSNIDLQYYLLSMCRRTVGDFLKNESKVKNFKDAITHINEYIKSLPPTDEKAAKAQKVVAILNDILKRNAMNLVNYMRDQNIIDLLAEVKMDACEFVDPDLFFEIPESRAINAALTDISNLLASSSLGIDQEGWSLVLGEYNFPPTTIFFNTKYAEQYVDKNPVLTDNVYLSFGKGGNHFSRLIPETQLEQLKQAAHRKNVDVIEIKITGELDWRR